MPFDARKQCSVCAWRAECTKKFRTEESNLHCADFTRDKKIPADESEAASPETGDRMKTLENVFGD
ncbi:MAG: hypothetical protein C0608_05170 [Deltaproteobacteria bacterium]|nr:MAG: hypothetical protein C0608_05170 [Deltaproteobacteria bacterium]